MQEKNLVFYVAAAIAFLTATPMIAGPTALPVMPNLHFVEDSAPPSRAVTQDFITCGERTKGDTAARHACELSIKDALKDKRNADK